MGSIPESYDIKKSSYRHRRLALAGIMGPVVFLLASTIAGMLQPGYSMIKNTISSLVWMPYGWMQTAGFYILGILIIIFSIGLYRGIGGEKWLKPGISIFILIGAGMVMLGIFPTNPESGPTMHGAVHHFVARTVGILFPIFCFLLIPSLKADSRWRPLTVFTVIAGVAIVILIGGWIWLVVSGMVNAWVGLFERVFMATAVIWLEVMALRLLFLPETVENINSGQKGRLNITGEGNQERKKSGILELPQDTGLESKT